MPERVAVIIPCRNYGRYLGEALESVLAQTHPPSEVIVVDDGSADDTAAVCARFPEARYVHQEQAGANAARNLGLSLVERARFVMFLDADDVLDPNYIRRCLDSLSSDPGASFAYTQWRKFGVGAAGETSTFPQWSVPRLLEKNYIHISALMRTEVLRSSGFDPTIRAGNMDWDLYLTLAERGERGVLVDEPLLLYRQHASSVQAGLRKSGHARSVIAIRLAWKHRRLYGWRRLLARVRFHLAAMTKAFVLIQGRRAAAKARGAWRRLRRV